MFFFFFFFVFCCCCFFFCCCCCWFCFFCFVFCCCCCCCCCFFVLFFVVVVFFVLFFCVFFFVFFFFYFFFFFLIHLEFYLNSDELIRNCRFNFPKFNKLYFNMKGTREYQSYYSQPTKAIRCHIIQKSYNFRTSIMFNVLSLLLSQRVEHVFMSLVIEYMGNTFSKCGSLEL